MASVTVNLTGYFDNGLGTIAWNDDVVIGSTFDMFGSSQTLTQVRLFYSGGNVGQVNISIIGVNNRFTAEFEANGRIIFAASDGELLEVMIANADMTEEYFWEPTNSTEVIAFANHVRTLTDQNATLTLTDDPPTFAPSFTDNTGDSQSWTVGTANHAHYRP